MLPSFRSLILRGIAALALLLQACGGSGQEAFCADAPSDEGLLAFDETRGTRLGRELLLSFFAQAMVDEEFSRAPQVDTNLGEVLDLDARGRELRVRLLLPSTEDVLGVIRLRGDLSGTFQEGTQRCAFDRQFQVTAPSHGEVVVR